jgi:hypothetical protein
MFRTSYDCVAFAEGADTKSIDVLMVIQTLRYHLRPRPDPHVFAVLDVIFEKFDTGQSSYLMIAHPFEVEMQTVPNVMERSYGRRLPGGGSHSQLLERLYGKRHVDYRLERKHPTLRIRCVEFPGELKARYPIIGRDSPISVELGSLLSHGGDHPEKDTLLTVAKVGPFIEKDIYGVRLFLKIGAEVLEATETVSGLFRVAGPNRLLAELEERIYEDKLSPYTDSGFPEFILDGRKRRTPHRYDVVLLNGNNELPRCTTLTSDVTRLEHERMRERVILFSCADPRQEFNIEMNFNAVLSPV